MMTKKVTPTMATAQVKNSCLNAVFSGVRSDQARMAIQSDVE